MAVTAAQSLLDQGHDVMLTTAHAEFGFPHGGCGLWDTSVLDWPLPTLEEAVAVQDRSRITCRSQWLVKRLVHLFTAAGGRTSTRVRLQQLEGEWHATGTGTVPLADVHHVLLADQDVTEPFPSVGLPCCLMPRLARGTVPLSRKAQPLMQNTWVSGPMAPSKSGPRWPLNSTRSNRLRWNP